MKVLPIDALGSKLDEANRALLAEADVIIAVDELTRREFTVFGTPSLESTVTIKKPTAMQVVQVPLDFENGELDELALIVREIKGIRVARRAKIRAPPGQATAGCPAGVITYLPTTERIDLEPIKLAIFDCHSGPVPPGSHGLFLL